MSFISKQENYLIDGKEEQKFQKHKDSSFETRRIEFWNINDWNWTNSPFYSCVLGRQAFEQEWG